jgi:hypothetical protein
MLSSRGQKGNLGEWSELYTLSKLLVDGGGYSADSNQKRIDSHFHKVDQIVIAGSANENETIYIIEKDKILVLQDGLSTKTVMKSELRSCLEDFFCELTNGKNSRTFPLVSGERLLSLLGKNSISAKSDETINDLELVIEDPVTGGLQPRSGYSIKSQLGQDSTLLNSSGSTNIIYKIHSPNSGSVPSVEGPSHKKNIQSLYEQGFELIFDAYQREVFATNLSYVDSQLPENLAKVILQHYLINDTNDYSATVEMVFPQNQARNDQIIFKFKQLLVAISMGLRPAKAWKGSLEKFKGLLVVTREGEILFYPQETKLNFQDFLYSNVRFDRPSTGRHKYGSVYKVGNEHFIKLNFQIRFK